MMMKTNSSKMDGVSPRSKLAYTVSNTAINPMMTHSPQVFTLNQTQTTNANQSSYRDGDKRTGLIKLKVHEFTMSKMEK